MKCTEPKIAVYLILINVHSRGTQAPNTEDSPIILECPPCSSQLGTPTIPLTLINPMKQPPF